MSSQITLNTWSGESKKEATAELSKVFRMDLEKALVVVENLCQGLPWRFNYTISNEQAKHALKYLQNIGFSVDIKSVNNGVEPLAEPEFFERTETATRSLPDNESSYRMGFRGDGQTLWNQFHQPSQNYINLWVLPILGQYQSAPVPLFANAFCW